MSSEPQNEKEKLYSLLQLEAMARRAQSAKELCFLIANETRKLINYRQAFLFLDSGLSGSKYKVETVSSIATIEGNEPHIVWLNKLLAQMNDTKDLAQVLKLDAASCPQEYRQEWSEYTFSFVVWIPLQSPDGRLLGGLWLTRENPWQENEIVLLKHLADSYAHAMIALDEKKHFFHQKGRTNNITWAVLAVLVLVCFIPIRLSTLAPAEIVAKDSIIVSAPIDGIVQELIEDPNTMVKQGDTLLLFEDTSFKNQYAIAKKTLSVTEAELRKARQAAFADNRSKAEIAVLKSQVDLRKSELDYATELLNKVVLKAETDGLLIYSAKDDWKGRPVRVGERIMQIADPTNIKLKIELAVADAILLERGAEVEVFLDTSPLNSLPAQITHASYHAGVTANDILAYELDAEFVEQNPDLRIGLRGTAKIYGERVSLFFYLFRRPISALRQMIGL